jgi:hypothetical protein
MLCSNLTFGEKNDYSTKMEVVDRHKSGNYSVHAVLIRLETQSRF